MSSDAMMLTAVIGVVVLLLVVGMAIVVANCHIKVPSGQALVVNQGARVVVSFTGAMVIPGLHRAELVDVSIKTIEIERIGKHGLRCRDGVRADVRVRFLVRINRTEEDVLRVAQSIGAERAGQAETLNELFTAKFANALEEVASNVAFSSIVSHREELRHQVMQVIGMDLNGYVLDDVVIESLAQTPIEMLDPNDILDAQGIRAITEQTVQEQIRTNELRQQKAQMLARLELETKQLMVDIERQQADALARLRADTGRSLTVEQLEDRVVERLRKMVDEVVTERLARKE